MIWYICEQDQIYNCQDGYFEKGFPDNVCASCDTSCKTCYGDGSDNCLSCDTTYLNLNDECVDPCGTGYVGISGVCEQCDSGCETCDTSQDNCLTCNFGYFHYNVDNTCLTTCPDGYYPSNKQCLQCDPTCFNCDWSTATDCTECTGTLYLYDSQCIATCPDGTYTNTASNTCTICDSTCETCSGPADTECLTCDTYYKGYYFYADENRCLTKTQCESLSPDHVIDLDDVDGENVSCIELICDPTCQTCDQNKYYNCLSCASPRYLLYTQCVNTCLSYQFGDAATRTCMDCASECATCEFTDDYCYTCNDGYYYLAADFVCYDECPIGYFEEDTTMTCDICDTNCMECDQTATTCTFCYEGTYLLNEICIAACPDLAYYTDEVANACYPCNYQCPLNYCSGPAYSDCLTVCPDGYFEQTSSRTCEPCYPGCTLCDGAATVCSACAPNFLLQGTDCVDDCPVSFYFDETDVVCYACDASCYMCEGPAANQCTACEGNRFLQGNQCVIGCAGTGVTGDLTDNVCRNCDSSCTACYDYPNQCTACAAGYYLSGTLCQLCSDGYYGSGTACYECHNDCLTCYGPDADNCNSCDPSRTLYLQVSTCQGNCDAGYYLDTSTGICRQCNTGCATCVNKANNCLSCTGFYILYNNKCNHNYCPAGYVIDYANNICEQCDSTCETCTGTTSSDCSSCEYQQRYYYSGQCLTDCPVGYYKNTYSSTCIHCASECATCADDDGSLCYSCTSGYLEGTTCVTSCSDGYFKVPGIDVCNLCQNIVPSNINSYCTSSLCPGMKPSDDNQSCEEICGDGIRITDTIECDDGNNEDGDGCSSNCKVEYLWECSGGDGSNPDVCIDKTEIGFTIDTTNTTYYNYGENAIFAMNIEFNKTFTLPLGVAIQDLIYVEIEGHDKQFDYQLYSLNRRMLETQNQEFLYNNQNQQQQKQKQKKYDLRQLTSIQATQYLLEMELTETIRNREISVTFYPKEYFWSLDGSVSLSADSKQVGTIERYMYYSETERNITGLYKYLQPAIGIILIITFINMLRYDETHDNKFYYCHTALDSLQLIYFYRFVDLRWPLEGFRFFEQMVHMTDFFIPNLFAGMQSTLSNQKVFEFYFITSSFLENSGGPLLLLFIFLVIIAFVGLFQIQKFYQNHEQNNFYAFFYKIRNVRLQYGIFIDYYLITGTTFFTYGILQFLDPSETTFYVYSTQYMIRNQAQLYDKEEMIAEQIKQRKTEYNQYQKKKRENKIKEEIGSLIEIEDQQIEDTQKKNSVDSKEEEFYAPVYELPIVKRAQEDVKFYENLLIDFNQNYEQKITSQLVLQKLESRNVDIDVQLTDSTFRFRNFWTGIKPNDFLKPGSSKSKSKLQRKMNEKIILYQLIILIRKFLAPLIIVLFNSSAYTQIILLQILHLSILFGWWFNSFSIFLRKRDNIRAFLSEFLTFLGVCGFYLMISDTSEDEGRRTRISLFCIFIFMLIFLLHFFFLAGEEIKNIYKYLKEQKDRRHKKEQMNYFILKLVKKIF
ncbi:Insulin-like growth factor binding protein, N-terminal [Pseudocohnilembus persalinus]|uniref:Insulin-like growth factor binding protein, N-terminal n=1 Tax=Pseudocohnilembus persalinus TaxID=266149 RepID=A0A0V0QCC6_PSEPJ|nr:Insulin-like growth factor binding protein, N-terminal [Pseudocohnilembus persalinus]|eukprot:KRW99700.1 Insulin-like growth factor binding protein, N-terminal [Pseudocohnilembus persalinus]